MTLEQAREKTERMNSESLAKSYCYKTNEIKRLKEKINKLEGRNSLLEAKIMKWYLKDRKPEFAELFGIK